MGYSLDTFEKNTYSKEIITDFTKILMLHTYYSLYEFIKKEYDNDRNTFINFIQYMESEIIPEFDKECKHHNLDEL